MQSHQHPERAVLRGTWHCKMPRHYRGEGSMRSRPANRLTTSAEVSMLQHCIPAACHAPDLPGSLCRQAPHTLGGPCTNQPVHAGDPQQGSAAHRGDPLAWGRLKVLSRGPRSPPLLGFPPGSELSVTSEPEPGTNKQRRLSPGRGGRGRSGGRRRQILPRPESPEPCRACFDARHSPHRLPLPGPLKK